MGKVNKILVNNQTKSEEIALPSVNKLSVVAKTNSLHLSSFGGMPILKEAEKRLALASQLASCLHDKRAAHLVRHSFEELIMTRIFQICLGYEDVSDCNLNRHEPMMQYGVKEDFDETICSASTMCRFENNVTEEELLAIQEMFVTMFVLSYHGKEPSHIILDCDDTNVNTHGAQELSLFNSYYDSYCYMPLLIFEGYSGKMILPLLKPGRRNKTANIADTLQWLITVLREAWPNTIITVRGDSHFCSHEFMDWAFTQKRILFITGLAANSVLLNNPIVSELIEQVKHDYELFHHPCRKFGEFSYKAGTWKFAQRVVVKVEITEAGGKPNIRFIVSNIRSTSPKGLYETTYCKRGMDELYIREFKEAVNGDRLSCHSFNANRMRIFLHAAAYILMHSIRENGLKGTALEKATLLEIRGKILLTAVNLRIRKKSIGLDYSKYNPMDRELRHLLHFYSKTA